ncbi:MAG: thioredoxin [Lachnospiraceae bacterium]|jgi:thioredoxin 1|nr:thioredoxin [Lachnospiraceae bacterium]
MANIFTSDTFDSEVIGSSVPVLVDFYADWCMPCKMIAPLVAALEETHGDRLKVGKVNVDQSKDIAAKYRVMSIPTIILFKGGEALERIVGAVSQSELDAALGKVLS